MIPPFTGAGLLPPGEHGCRWNEFVERFGGAADNKRRRRLLLGLAQLLLALADAGCLVAYIDGSFVTHEKWPKDFDVCYEARGMSLDRLTPVLRDISQGRLAQKRKFGGEAVPTNFPFDWSGRTVRDAFAFTREGEAKGIIRLLLSEDRAALEEFIAAVERERQSEAEGVHATEGGEAGAGSPGDGGDEVNNAGG